MKYSKSELQEKVNKIRWFHSIELPYGITTPGLSKRNKEIWEAVGLKDLHGKHVLDVGCAEGYYSLKAEEAGAEVLALDKGDRKNSNEGINLAIKARESKVIFREMDAQDISSSKIGEFDIVFYLGVLYHIRNPMLALDRIAEVCKGELILETEFFLGPLTQPTLHLVKKQEPMSDPNWFVPNESALRAMLHEAGFAKVHKIRSWLFKPSPKNACMYGRILLKAEK